MYSHLCYLTDTFYYNAGTYDFFAYYVLLFPVIFHKSIEIVYTLGAAVDSCLEMHSCMMFLFY